MNKWLITGSVAAKHWIADFRYPKDIDILSSVYVKSQTPSELAIETQWNSVADRIIECNSHSTFVDLNMLYTIKVSHAAWDIKWDKTIHDVTFLKSRGAKIDHSDILDALIDHWTTVHGCKKVNLNQMNDSFFTRHVKRIIDHDELHAIIANGSPMHEKIRLDKDRPMCSVDLWNSLSYRDQVKTAREEMMVIAIERYLTGIKHSDIMVALCKSYRNLVLSMTRGWFNLFLIENRSEILSDREYLISNVTRTFNLLRERKLENV